MSRSKWKATYFKQIKILKKNDSNFLHASRNSKITSQFLGKNFRIHNGKTYNDISVLKDMINHKFGEFSFTRQKFSFKKNKK